MLKFQTENEQDKVQISDTLIELLIKSAEETLRFEGFQEVTAEVDLSIIDNVGIQAINKEHREKDQVTDVLSFPQYENLKDLEELEEEYLYLGDIVISAEKAVEQAALYAHSFEREMCFLVVHSMLHLLGYDHLTPSDEAYMKELQETILDNLGIKRA